LHRNKIKVLVWIIPLIALAVVLAFDIWGIFWLAGRQKPISPQPVSTTRTSTSTSTSIPTGIITPISTLTATITPQIGSTWIRPADGMVMVYVPKGVFTMGRNDGDTVEKPLHMVTLDAFWIDKTEITNAMYGECELAGGCKPASQPYSKKHNLYTSSIQFSDYPVIFVDWYASQAYCKWAGGRLPTEAEWEKAARGTDGRKFPWGNTIPTCKLANYWSGNRGCLGDTTPVGSYPAGASPYGALDMGGNVWEWVADWYDEDYYLSSPFSNPRGPILGFSRTLRGGSFGDVEGYLSTSVRLRYAPSFSLNYVGFRCVRSSQ
jgi:eukaryotic-like serine/threonine-protein kinase